MSKKFNGGKDRHSNIRGNRRNRRSHKHGMFIVRGKLRDGVINFLGKAADLALAAYDLAVGVVVAVIMVSMSIRAANKATNAGKQPR